MLEGWRRALQSYAGLSSKRGKCLPEGKKDTRKGVMFEKAKKQLSVITGPSHKGDESHALTMEQCATVWNKQSLELKIVLGHKQKPSHKGYLQLGAKHTKVTNRRPTGTIYSSTTEAMPCWQGGRGELEERGRADHSHGGVPEVARSKQKILRCVNTCKIHRAALFRIYPTTT